MSEASPPPHTTSVTDGSVTVSSAPGFKPEPSGGFVDSTPEALARRPQLEHDRQRLQQKRFWAGFFLFLGILVGACEVGLLLGIWAPPVWEVAVRQAAAADATGGENRAYIAKLLMWSIALRPLALMVFFYALIACGMRLLRPEVRPSAGESQSDPLVTAISQLAKPIQALVKLVSDAWKAAKA